MKKLVRMNTVGQVPCQLWDSLMRRNIHDFRIALEERNFDLDQPDDSSGLSIFQTVLQTPNSVDFIQLCMDYGADLYAVSCVYAYDCLSSYRIVYRNTHAADILSTS